jgi:glucose-6-phosphate isomerase
MYEHKIFVQGIIWNILALISGVLNLKLANSILEEINTNTIQNHDSSTSFLLNHF